MVLATYGMVLRDRDALAEVAWDITVADEAQYVKNSLSRSPRELRSIPAAVRVALTGKPVENRLSDLWSILDWTTPGLLAATVRPFLLRRRKTDPDVASELPRKTETDRVVPLTPEQATLYEAVVRESWRRSSAPRGWRGGA